MLAVILNIEATCWSDKLIRQREIIEIGAVAYSGTELVGEFTELVMPKINPEISDFCMTFTGISQEKINGAAPFSGVVKKFKDWLGSFGESPVFITWGDKERVRFLGDCEYHNVDTKWLSAEWLNLKSRYAEINDLKRPVGIKYALHKEKIPTLAKHNSLDNSKSTAKIFLKYYDNLKMGMTVEKVS